MLGRAVFVLCVLVGSARAEIRPPSVTTMLGNRGADCIVPVTQLRPSSSAATPDAEPAPTVRPTSEQAVVQPTRSSPDDRGVAVAFMLMGLCGLAFMITRGTAVRRTFATSRNFADADLAQLQLVAGAQRPRTIVFALSCVGMLAAIASLPLSVEAQAVLAVTPLMLLAIAIVALCRLQLLLALRPEPCLRVMSHGFYFFAARGKRLVGWVGATPSMMARASGLPTATARHV